jgi:hypothetical protein
VFGLWSFGCDTVWSAGWYWQLRGTCCTILVMPLWLRRCTRKCHNPKDQGLDISMFGNTIEILTRYFLNTGVCGGAVGWGTALQVRRSWVQFTRWRSWLRHCATSQKVAGSVPDYVVVIFHWHNPSGRTMALGLTQALTEMSTRNISWGVEAAGA